MKKQNTRDSQKLTLSIPNQINNCFHCRKHSQSKILIAMKHKFKSHQFEKKAGIISLQNGRRKVISFKHRKTKQKNKTKKIIRIQKCSEGKNLWILLRYGRISGNNC